MTESPGELDGVVPALVNGPAQAEINARVWRSGRYLSDYDNVGLKPAEALILARYRDALTGRVLDLGCGAGRLFGYLVLLGADAHGIDISPQMVEHCRRRFPGADVRVGDLADLRSSVEGQFDAVVMSDNLIDVFDDVQRRRVLGCTRDLLNPGGLLIFSSHNLDHWDQAPARSDGMRDRLGAAVRRSPAGWAWMLGDLVVGRRNRRRLRPLQRRTGDHAVVNDSAHHYSLLHYYIGRVGQERQLSELGLELLDVLETAGPSVPAGETGQSDSLYYVATAAAD
jgi:SAM-dependent methyltransferase